MKAHSRPSKVVIPVAGLGSRFLPATKAIPKELLPIIDRPIIHFIVQEAVAAGLETVVFVTSRPKVLIEDYFDPGDLVSLRLRESGKDELIESVLELSKKINIVSVRQYEPLGLGHAVLTAEPIVGQESFAVVLGDDIIKCPGSESAIGQCLKLFNSKENGHVVGTLTVDPSERSKYGIAEVNDEQKVLRFIEKPSEGETQSCLALPGRYVFGPNIFASLKEIPPGRGGEIQLTDAMEHLLKKEAFYASTMNGERFDTGDKLGYIMANVAFALENKEYKEVFRDWLKTKINA